MRKRIDNSEYIVKFDSFFAWKSENKYFRVENIYDLNGWLIIFINIRNKLSRDEEMSRKNKQKKQYVVEEGIFSIYPDFPNTLSPHPLLYPVCSYTHF